MNCKNCNQEISENTKFCPNCGSKIEQTEEVNEVIKHNEIDEVLELPPVNLNTQRNSNLNKKKSAIAIVLIISISSITLYKIFNDKGKDAKEPIISNTEDTDKVGEAKEGEEVVYDEFPVTVQEAISIAEKVITSGRVEVLSDRIRKDGKFYYEVGVFREVEYVTVKEGTLYIDKETGDVFMPDTVTLTNPWIKVEGVIDASTNHQVPDTPVTANPNTNKPLTQGDYYAKIMGGWTDNNEIRTYAKEGYYVDMGGLNMVTGEFSIIIDKDEIDEILKYYRESLIPNVFTKPKTQIVEPQSYDINKFEDIITDADLEKAVIVNIKNNNEDSIYKGLYKAEYKELMIFTSDDYRQAKIYELQTGENIALKEVGDFFKTTKQQYE